MVARPELFAGVALALWVTGDRPPRWSAPVGDVAGGAGLAVLIGLMLFVDYSPPWLLRGGYGFVAIVSAVTILGALAHGRVARALGGRPLVALGTISYSLYLVHWPTILVVDEERTGLHRWPLAVVRIAVAVVVAIILHVVVERPIRHLRTPWWPTVAAWLAASAAVTLAAVVIL